jgi:hypothetical protein
VSQQENSPLYEDHWCEPEIEVLLDKELPHEVPQHCSEPPIRLRALVKVELVPWMAGESWSRPGNLISSWPLVYISPFAHEMVSPTQI